LCIILSVGKGLARRPAGNQFYAILPLVKLHVTDILFKKPKVLTHRLPPVFFKGAAGICVALNYGNRLKPCLVQSKRKPASASK
jgi:hypothetical protein